MVQSNTAPSIVNAARARPGAGAAEKLFPVDSGSNLVVYSNYMKTADHRYHLHTSLGHLASRFSRAVVRRLNCELVRHQLPITPEQYLLLGQLWDSNGLPQGALAEKTAKDKTTMARLAAGLEERGLIVRLPSPGDARERLLYLTDAGKDLMDQATALAKGIVEEAQQGISEEELELCRDVLRRAYANLLK
ncbi:MarR family winged helix-turn-helix transcriptional regulator [Geomonas sp. Red276]